MVMVTNPPNAAKRILADYARIRARYEQFGQSERAEGIADLQKRSRELFAKYGLIAPPPPTKPLLPVKPPRADPYDDPEALAELDRAFASLTKPNSQE
jgi:hypothetical protein